jgi:hypothetical protein
MERRKNRTQAILRDILRSRREWECPTAGYQEETGHDVLLEEEISFRLTEPHPRGPARCLAHWLFINGGMSVVLIAGLMLFGIIAAILGIQ